MRNTGFLIFLTIFLAVYAAVNLYIFKRGWPTTRWMGGYRYIPFFVFVFLALAYPVGRFAERSYRCQFTELLIYVGSFHMAMMVYFFLLILLIDLVRLPGHLFHWFPVDTGRDWRIWQMAPFLSVVIVVLGLVTAGHINASHPRVRRLDLTIAKPAGSLKTLNIVMASDLHLGRNMSDTQLIRVVDRINALEPDLVLLPGDIMDEDIDSLTQGGIAEAIRSIRARFGVFAATGNHEYFSGVRRAVDYLERANVRVLEDAVLKIEESFYIVGRKDRMAQSFGEKRVPLEELLRDVDRSVPTILMDHQPVRLEEAGRSGVDLQFSGHTHHGQLFPFNWITNAMYEVSWGYLKKGSTHYYVSCGLGTWGPPVRIGNVPELVHVKVRFEGAGDRSPEKGSR